MVFSQDALDKVFHDIRREPKLRFQKIPLFKVKSLQTRTEHVCVCVCVCGSLSNNVFVQPRRV